MQRILLSMLSASGMLVTFGAQAQTAPPAPTAQSGVAANPEGTGGDTADESTNVEGIVVTARRIAERAQDVPQTIDAVSGAHLDQLAIFNFQDIGSVIPGLTLSTGTITTLRGVTFNPVSQAGPTVSMYLNDTPLQSDFVFQSMFDVGQIEVLRGPQGTYRGQSAPTGAITITTRRPDLSEFGITASATATSLDERNIQGAVNLPIIPNKFSIRIAALTDHTDNGGVTSINSTVQPYFDTNAFRISALAQPIDDFSALVMFQNLRTTTLGFSSAEYGSGAPGGAVTGATGYALPYVQPVGVNGAPIAIGHFSTAANDANYASARQQVATAQLDYQFGGQALTYIGGYSTIPPGISTTYGDQYNQLGGGNYPGISVVTSLTRWNHELHLASGERIAGFLDYVVGVFHQTENIVNTVYNGVDAFEPGAFGSPLGAPIPQNPNQAYTVSELSLVPSHTTELSEFGTLTAHIWNNTEISGGVRFIRATQNSAQVNTLTSAQSAQTLSPTACAAAGGTYGTTYAGVCNVPVPGSNISTLGANYTKHPIVYSASLSHHFTDDMMAYFTTGTSWRAGPTQDALPGAPSSDPLVHALDFLPDEKSRSFELGLKSTWLDDRLRANVAAYHQTYSNYVYQSYATGVVVYRTAAPPPADFNITVGPIVNVPVTVNGVDFNTTYAIMKNWDMSGGISYANGHIKNGSLPCYDPTFSGVAGAAPTNFGAILGYVAGLAANNEYVRECPGYNASSSSAPSWNATLQSQYSHPIAGDVDGFVNGILTYDPRNPYTSSIYTVPSYALLNLYLGARNWRDGWEVQVFAKNLMNRQVVTGRASASPLSDALTPYFGSSGYISNVTYGPRREFGVTIRYSVGAK
jgi:outer membrane receptor protein involved in Fe transport